MLFYIYPLKFMFTSLFQQMLGWGSHTAQSMPPIQVGQARTLMLVYSAGFLGVFVVFVLMYLHAWRRRGRLRLRLHARQGPASTA